MENIPKISKKITDSVGRDFKTKDKEYIKNARKTDSVVVDRGFKTLI